MIDRELPNAVVIGLDCITGLQTARLLARHDIPVVGIAADPQHFACRTRVCREKLTAGTKNEQFIELLEQMGPRLTQKAVLYPCTDMSVLQVSRHRDRLSRWYHVALPPAEIVELLLDKVQFYTYAQQQGLPIPATRFLHSRADAERAAAEVPFPCILKPPVKTMRWEQHTKAKVFKIYDADELLRVYDRCAGWAELLMVQQWVEGTDAELFSFNGYFDRDNQPLATFIARKLRQWPPQTGTSCLGQECRNDEVLEAAVRLFQAVGYHGLAYVELKRDVQTGRHYIIEPNIGRPTGRSAISEAGGVELLYTKYCDQLGLPLPTARVQKYTDAKWIYWRQDLRSAYYYWRRGELSLGQWWASLRGRKTSAVFSWRDPLPFLADWWRVLLAGRARRRAAGAAAAGAATASAAAAVPAAEREAEQAAGAPATPNTPAAAATGKLRPAATSGRPLATADAQRSS